MASPANRRLPHDGSKPVNGTVKTEAQKCDIIRYDVNMIGVRQSDAPDNVRLKREAHKNGSVMSGNAQKEIKNVHHLPQVCKLSLLTSANSPREVREVRSTHDVQSLSHRTTAAVKARPKGNGSKIPPPLPPRMSSLPNPTKVSDMSKAAAAVIFHTETTSRVSVQHLDRSERIVSEGSNITKQQSTDSSAATNGIVQLGTNNEVKKPLSASGEDIQRGSSKNTEKQICVKNPIIPAEDKKQVKTETEKTVERNDKKDPPVTVKENCDWPDMDDDDNMRTMIIRPEAPRQCVQGFRTLSELNDGRTTLQDTERLGSNETETSFGEIVTKVKGNCISNAKRDKSKSREKSAKSKVDTDEVRQLARNMAGSMESVIDSLHHVVGDIQQLMLQIDIVTDTLERKHRKHKPGCSSTVSIQGSVGEDRKSQDRESLQSLQGSFEEDPTVPTFSASYIQSVVDQYSTFIDHGRVKARERSSRSKGSHRFSYPQYGLRGPDDAETVKCEFSSHRRTKSSKHKHADAIERLDKDISQNDKSSKSELKSHSRKKTKHHPGLEKSPMKQRASHAQSRDQNHGQFPAPFTDPDTERDSVLKLARADLYSITTDDSAGDNCTHDLTADSNPKLPSFFIQVPRIPILPSVLANTACENMTERSKDCDTIPGIRSWREKTEHHCSSAESLTPQMDWSYLALSELEPVPNLRLQSLRVPCTDNSNISPDILAEKHQRQAVSKQHINHNSNLLHGNGASPIFLSSNLQLMPSTCTKRDRSKLALTGLKIKHQKASIAEAAGSSYYCASPHSVKIDTAIVEVPNHQRQQRDNLQAGDEVFLPDKRRSTGSSLGLSEASYGDLCEYSDDFRFTEQSNNFTRTGKLADVVNSTYDNVSSVASSSENTSSGTVIQAQTDGSSMDHQSRISGEVLCTTEEFTSVLPSSASQHTAVPKLTQAIGGAPLGWNANAKALPGWPKSAGDLSSISASDSEIDDLSSPFLPQHFHPRTSSTKDASPDWNSTHLFPGYVHCPRRASVRESSPVRNNRHFLFPPRRSSAIDSSPEWNPAQMSPADCPQYIARSSSTALTTITHQKLLKLHHDKDARSSDGSREIEAQPVQSYDITAAPDKHNSVFCSSAMSQSSSASEAAHSEGFEVRTKMETSPESDVTDSYKGNYENAMEKRLERLGSEADASDFSDAEADVGSDVLEQSLTSMESSGAKYDREVITWKSYTMTHIDSDDVVSECSSDVLNENLIDRVTTNPGFDDVYQNFDDVTFPSIAY